MRFKMLGAYSCAAYVGQLCNVLISAVFIRTLSAATLGDIAIAKIWMQLLDYAHLGFRFALDRLAPVWPRERSRLLLGICVSVSSIVGFVVAVIALMTTSNLILTFCFLVAGYSVALATILKSYSRALSDSKKMLGIYLVCPTAPLLVQTVAVLFYDFDAFLIWGAFAHAVAWVWLIYELRPFSKRSMVATRRAIVLAWPTSRVLILSASVGFASFAVDKILMLHYGNKTVLGEYSVVLFAFAMVVLVPNTVSEFVFPKIIRLAVKSKRYLFLREAVAVMVPTFISICVAYFSVPFAVDWFHNYVHLVHQLQIVLLGVPPYAVIPILFHTMSAHNMGRQLLWGSSSAFAMYTLMLIYIGEHISSDILNEFIVARVGFGYLLAATYALLLLGEVRRRNSLLRQACSEYAVTQRDKEGE